tara:strand:+ start:571 stop:747 length:177 start_codon:yes stop_codon:yes gene_type:complete
MSDIIKIFVQEEKGQNLVEYALLLTFLALAAIAIIPQLGETVYNLFNESASTVETGTS